MKRPLSQSSACFFQKSDPNDRNRVVLLCLCLDSKSRLLQPKFHTHEVAFCVETILASPCSQLAVSHLRSSDDRDPLSSRCGLISLISSPFGPLHPWVFDFLSFQGGRRLNLSHSLLPTTLTSGDFTEPKSVSAYEPGHGGEIPRVLFGRCDPQKRQCLSCRLCLNSKCREIQSKFDTHGVASCGYSREYREASLKLCHCPVSVEHQLSP